MGTLIDSDKVKEYLDKFEEELTNNIISIVRENYIHKSDYENRLKAEKVAMLEDLLLEIEEGFSSSASDCTNLIQKKIDDLRGNADVRN